jgi:hypothetical protein
VKGEGAIAGREPKKCRARDRTKAVVVFVRGTSTVIVGVERRRDVFVVKNKDEL